MNNKSNNDFKVRLSRTSSAQAVLTKERKKSGFKLDEIIDEDKSMDTVTGKLPTEAAYVIMKRVTLEAGHPLNPAGISTFNKLQSLKTTPAVDLLMHQTWRNFFSKKTAAHTSMAMSKPAPQNEEIPQLLMNPALSSADDLLKHQKEIKSHLTGIFDRLVQRVEHLWTVMKIPSADRTFYRKSLCKGPPMSVGQCREIAQYIAVLKAHQDATIAVIQAIQVREMAIAKCFDVLAALQRKFSRISHSHREQSLGGSCATPVAGSSFRNPFPTATGSTPQQSPFANQHQHHNHQFTFASSQQQQEPGGGSGGGGSGGGAMNFWKEELISVLDEVRASSLEVIRRVQLWRRNLWRPHPFVYMGVNYVAKMKDDLGILESDIYAKLLALVPLKYADLQCVVFFSTAGKIFVDTNGAVSTSAAGVAANGHDHDHTPVRTPFSTTSTSRLPPTYPTADFTQPWAASTNGFNKQVQNDSYIQQLLADFHHKVHPKELKLAATIVLEEEMLQNALAIEHASLLAKGVFIPTLHTRDANSDATVVARSGNANGSSSQHLDVRGGGNGGGGGGEGWQSQGQHDQSQQEHSQSQQEQEYSMFEDHPSTEAGADANAGAEDTTVQQQLHQDRQQQQQQPQYTQYEQSQQHQQYASQNHVPSMNGRQGPQSESAAGSRPPSRQHTNKDEEELDWAPDFAT